MTRTIRGRLAATLLALVALAAQLLTTGPARATDFPTYTWTAHPSPVVLFPAHRQLTLEPYTYCWSGPRVPPGGATASCADGTPPRNRDLPRTWHRRAIRFWFGRPGWTFTGRMRLVPSGCIIVRQRARITKVAPRQFLLAPPRLPGTYRVTLFGDGPEGDVTVAFKWVYGGRSATRLGGAAAPHRC